MTISKERKEARVFFCLFIYDVTFFLLSCQFCLFIHLLLLLLVNRRECLGCGRSSRRDPTALAKARRYDSSGAIPYDYRASSCDEDGQGSTWLESGRDRERTNRRRETSTDRRTFLCWKKKKRKEKLLHAKI